MASEHMVAFTGFEVPDASLPIRTTRDKVLAVQLEAHHSACVPFKGQQGIGAGGLGEIPDTNAAINATGNNEVLLCRNTRYGVVNTAERVEDIANRSQY